MSSGAVILFAHGAREPEWAQPFESISPSLDEAAARLATKGIKTVLIVPLFLAQGAHLKRELPAMVARIRKRHAKTDFRVTPALGEAPEIVAAITEGVQRAAR